jgi:hypothetical protein
MEVQIYGFGELVWMAHYGRIFFPDLGEWKSRIENRERKTRIEVL